MSCHFEIQQDQQDNGTKAVHLENIADSGGKPESGSAAKGIKEE